MSYLFFGFLYFVHVCRTLFWVVLGSAWRIFVYPTTLLAYTFNGAKGPKSLQDIQGLERLQGCLDLHNAETLLCPRPLMPSNIKGVLVQGHKSCMSKIRH